MRVIKTETTCIASGKKEKKLFIWKIKMRA